MTDHMLGFLAVTILLSVAAPVTAYAGGDADAGRLYFNGNCSGCHSLAPDINFYAPTLKCIVGGAAAAAPFSAYTEDMKAVRATGLIWSAAKLDTFLIDPKAYIARHLGKPDPVIMMQVKVAAATNRQDVIAYLESRCQ